MRFSAGSTAVFIRWSSASVMNGCDIRIPEGVRIRIRLFGYYETQPISPSNLDQTASLLANRRGFVHLEASWNPRPELMLTCIWLGKAVLAVDRISDRHKEPTGCGG